jgi:hypothetical protein
MKRQYHDISPNNLIEGATSLKLFLHGNCPTNLWHMFYSTNDNKALISHILNESNELSPETALDRLSLNWGIYSAKIQDSINRFLNSSPAISLQTEETEMRSLIWFYKSMRLRIGLRSRWAHIKVAYLPKHWCVVTYFDGHSKITVKSSEKVLVSLPPYSLTIYLTDVLSFNISYSHNEMKKTNYHYAYANEDHSTNTIQLNSDAPVLYKHVFKLLPITDVSRLVLEYIII